MRKTLLGFWMFFAVTGGTLADEHLDLARLSDSDLKNVTLALMPIDVEGMLALKTVLGRLPEELQKKKLRSSLYTYLPDGFRYESTFTSTAICTSLTGFTLTRRRFTLGSRTYVAMNLPGDGERLVTGCKADYLLFLKIVYAFDDKDSSFIDWNWQTLAGPVPQLKTGVPGECINYRCQFAFWSNRTRKIVTVGQVTAEGCGSPSCRYGKGGAWDRSIAELAKQLLEETPFFSEGLDASDFD